MFLFRKPGFEDSWHTLVGLKKQQQQPQSQIYMKLTQTGGFQQHFLFPIAIRFLCLASTISFFMSLVVHVLEMKSKCKLVVGCFWPTAKETRVSKGHFALAVTLLTYPSQKKSMRNVKALYSERQPWSLYCVYRWIHVNIPLGEHDIMLIWHIFQLLALLVEICNSSSAVCKQKASIVQVLGIVIHNLVIHRLQTEWFIYFKH